MVGCCCRLSPGVPEWDKSRGDTVEGEVSALAPALCVFSVSEILTLEDSAVVAAPGAVLPVLSLCLSLVRVAVVLFVSG